MKFTVVLILLGAATCCSGRTSKYTKSEDGTTWETWTRLSKALQSAVAKKDMAEVEDVVVECYKHIPSTGNLYYAGIKTGAEPGLAVGSTAHYIPDREFVIPANFYTNNLRMRLHLQGEGPSLMIVKEDSVAYRDATEVGMLTKFSNPPTGFSGVYKVTGLKGDTDPCRAYDLDEHLIVGARSQLPSAEILLIPSSHNCPARLGTHHKATFSAHVLINGQRPVDIVRVNGLSKCDAAGKCEEVLAGTDKAFLGQ